MSGRKIAYNTIIQVAGKFFGFFVSSFFLIILAGHLGTTGMGYYTTVTAFVAFFVNLADLGINIVMMREIAQNPEKRVEITGDFFGFRIIYSVAVMALAPVVAALIPEYRGLVMQGAAIAAFAQLLLLINQTFVSVLQVSLQLDRAVFAEIVNRVITLGLAYWGIHLYPQTQDFFIFVLWVTVIAAAANALVSYYFAGRLWVIRPHFHLKRWGPVLKIVAPMGLFSFLSMVHFKSDTIILSLLKTPYDVGIYGYAYKIAELMFSIPLLFVGIVFPQMSALFKQNREEFLAFTQKAFSVLFLVGLPFVVFIFLTAPYLTTLLSRQSFSDGVIAGNVLRVLAPAMIAWFFGALYQHILLAGTSYKGLIRNVTIAVILNIVLNLIFIPIFSYFAAASITVLTELIMLILTAVYVYRSTGFSAKLNGGLAVLSGTLVMSVITLAIIKYSGISLIDFAQAGRLYQLTLLMSLGAVGFISYLFVLWGWGSRSPLKALGSVIRK